MAILLDLRRSAYYPVVYWYSLFLPWISLSQLRLFPQIAISQPQPIMAPLADSPELRYSNTHNVTYQLLLIPTIT